MREKKHLQRKIVHLMKHNYKKSIEVHNELRVNVDEQQNGIDYTGEVLEITVARYPKKKNE